MDKKSLVLLTLATFLAFGMMLSIGIGLSAQDEAADLESRISDLE